MPLNPYFLQGSTSEQRLVQDLINEQLRMYGQDVVYLPRKIVDKKTIIKEIVASTFDDAYRLEAYLLNYQGFEGSGDVLSKFGEPYLRSNSNQEKSKTGLGLGLFIGKILLEKNFASINCRNSKTKGGSEVTIKWKNKDLFNI